MALKPGWLVYAVQCTEYSVQLVASVHSKRFGTKNIWVGNISEIQIHIGRYRYR